MEFSFPKGFFFGSATAAHQVEGGNRNDWADWEEKNAPRLAENARGAPPAGARLPDGQGWPSYILERYPNPLQAENYISGKACDHYHRYEEDFDIAQRLGHTAHRFSIEWSRIEPEEGIFDEKEIEHYRHVVRALRARNMEPFVTLWHFTLPLWLAKKGGVLHRDFPTLFARYGKKIATSIGKEITFWTTINEPGVYASKAYYEGTWPPEKKNVFGFIRAVRALSFGHIACRAAIKEILPHAKVGAAYNFIDLASSGGIFNTLLASSLKRWSRHPLRHALPHLDFIGLNYYFHHHLRHPDKKTHHEHVSDVGWSMHPEHIYNVLKDLSRYRRPIYVTENGIADARDAYRGTFIKEHLTWTGKAIKEGADVRGYFYWSLLDNFEWDKGFWPRFGLVEMDYRTMERKIRGSAREYKRIIEHGV